MYSAVDVCKADGVTLIPASQAESGQSGCNGGDQFMCSCMQPFDDTLDPSLAYGFAAFTSGKEEQTDCACYYAELTHDSTGAAPKRTKLIFQVTNTGNDVQSGNIDLQIPGGGLGAFTEGCPAQWKTPAQQWGETFGGVKSIAQCENLPESLQPGCRWRFTSWADNPVLKGEPKRVRCPKALIDRSGCQRKDELSVGAYQGTTDDNGKPAESKYKRDRSVCLAHAAQKSTPEGYANVGAGRRGQTDLGSGSASGSGDRPPVAGQQPPPTPQEGPETARTPPISPDDSSALPGGAAQPSSNPNPSPFIPKGHGGKMHKVCRKWH